MVVEEPGPGGLQAMWRLAQVLFSILQPLRMPGLIVGKITPSIGQ